MIVVDSAVERKKQQPAKEDELSVRRADSELIEMYLKAIWYIRERGEDIKVSSIARLLNVTQPSVVQMLRKLNRSQLVRCSKSARKRSREHIGKGLMRNTQLD